MIKKYFFLLLTAFVAVSCVEKELNPVLQIGDAPSITSPTGDASFVLTEDNADDLIAPFSWTAADFGFSAAVSYTVEIDVAGNNFDEAVTLAVVNGLSLESITVEKLNSIMLAKGRPDGVASPMDVRVMATINPDVDPVYSPTVSINVTPYKTTIVYPKLQVPGSYQGWDPAKENTVIFDRKSNGKFEGFIYFTDPNVEFKYTNGPSWDVNWGDTGADGTLDPGGENIKATDAGMYRLNVDINALTHTNALTNWGLIGSATPGGWDSDQDMTYDAATGYLTITLDLIVGDIKFRANDDWAINMGDNDGNKSLEYDGSNIAITEAGNYTIELILGVGDYTYNVKKN
ncbi:MAG: SusE domain-containing protein [Bacteroidia bacterium]|nr:SusE domain-containing protein [Bacteroidia bacterium]